MKIITSKGQLDIPTDYSITIEQSSPAFSHEGTQSLPIELPISDRNITTLDKPIRFGRVDRFVRKLDAKIIAGIFQKDGQLVIDSAGINAGIVGAIMLNESDLYSKIKDTEIKSIFASIIRNDFSAESNPVSSWYTHIYRCMKGEILDDFTAFPVATDFNEETGYFILNRPDYTSALDPWKLIWEARNITTDEESMIYPAGYGITPFLWLWRTIELIFAHYGYSVRNSIFSSDPLLKKIVLVNNTADAICKGRLNYADLVPDITVSGFLTFLEKKFLTHAYIYPESKTVDFVPLQSILSLNPDHNLSSLIDGEAQFFYGETRGVTLSSKTDIDGSAPAASTIFDLQKIYSSVHEINELDWRTYNWEAHGIPTFTTTMILRKATGQFYTIYFRRYGGPTNFSRLGSNYFKFQQPSMTSFEEYESDDSMPTMVEVLLGETADEKEAIIICPSIGKSAMRNVKLSSSNKDTLTAEKQEIIIAYAAGKADSTAYPVIMKFGVVAKKGTISPKYHLGTTQKRDNAGNIWADYDLTTTDLYKRFFLSWNNVLKNSNTEVECKIDYQDKDLMSLRLDVPKIILGQKVLLKKFSYSISTSVKHIISRFLLIKNQQPLIEDDVFPYNQ